MYHNYCFWCEQGQSNAIVAVVFDPDDSKTLVTCGKEHVYFWRIHNTRLERKSGYFEVHVRLWILHYLDCNCKVSSAFNLTSSILKFKIYIHSIKSVCISPWTDPCKLHLTPFSVKLAWRGQKYCCSYFPCNGVLVHERLSHSIFCSVSPYM